MNEKAERVPLGGVEGYKGASIFTTFLREHVWIEEATTKKVLKWEWWGVHEAMIRDMKERQLIVLKARQVSWSWFMAAYIVWNCLYNEVYTALVISQGEDEAKAFLEKCRFIWGHLPTWLKYELVVDNTEEMEFITGPKIQALPSTERAGRSYTGSLVLVDEAAFHPYAAKNYSAYSPTIDAGGQLIIISTANGVGNWFHGMYQSAKGGLSNFRARFYGWQVRPGRDEEWRRERGRDMAAAGRAGDLEQEYPGDEVTAFLLTGRPRFDLEAVQEAMGGSREAMGRQRLPEKLRQMEGLMVWQAPQAGVAYVMGTDSAQGLDGGDASCTVVLKARTLEHVATLHGNWEPDYFAEMSVLLGRAYGEAFWGVENAPQGHGHTVLATARRLQYVRLYWHERERNRRQERVGEEARAILGWVTSEVTKPGLIDDLSAAILSGALQSWDREFWGECMTYQVIRGKTGAAPRTHDDRVMAMGIARRMAMQPEAQESFGPYGGLRPVELTGSRSYRYRDPRER